MSRINSGLFVDGSLQARELVLSAVSVADSHVRADAAIAQTKLQHLHHKVWAETEATTVVAKNIVIHTSRAAGTLLAIRAGSIVPNTGGNTVTIDLHLNGASILTAPFDLDVGDAAYAIVEGVIDTAAYIADKVFEVVVTVSGADAAGLFVELVTEEASV